MDELDIESLDEAALMTLNARIVERLQFLHQQKTAAALQDLKIGCRVTFEGPGGITVFGIVIRRNRKTVTVHADDDRQWNVSPSLVKLAEAHVLNKADHGIVDEAEKVVVFPRTDRR